MSDKKQNEMEPVVAKDLIDLKKSIKDSIEKNVSVNSFLLI